MPLGTPVFASVQLKSEEVTGKFEHFCVFLIFKLKNRIISSKRCKKKWETNTMENQEPRYALNSTGLITERNVFFYLC